MDLHREVQHPVAVKMVIKLAQTTLGKGIDCDAWICLQIYHFPSLRIDIRFKLGYNGSQKRQMVRFPAPIGPSWSLAEGVLRLWQSQALALRMRRQIPRREEAFSHFHVKLFPVWFSTHGVSGTNL